MRWFVAVIVLAGPGALPPAAFGQSVVYIVRHAEKEAGTGDVSLSEAGRKRAQALAALLKSARIQGIYTSDARRTRETAEPLATDDVPIVAIDHGDPAVTAQRIRADHKSDAVLVVGHSNTIEKLLQQWAPEGSFTVADTEFDNILIVTPLLVAADSSQKKASWVRLRYTVPGP